ncbi:unnamed protein product [Knipowitschia caucasica]
MHCSSGCAVEQECLSLLPRVCELLSASGVGLPDDTSLEKLLDWFTQLSNAGTSLLESFPCLLEFIPAVTQNNASDPAIICFTIKLTGLLAATVKGFHILQDRSNLTKVFDVKQWQEAGLWEDPSVRSGWVHGLRSMMQHQEALSLFLQSELTEHLLRLQTDPSLFVASSSNQLLAHILLFYQPEPPITNGKDLTPEETCMTQNGSILSASSSQYNTLVMGICDYLKESLLPKEQEHPQQKARLLRLIAQVLSQAHAPLRGKLFDAVYGPLEGMVTAANGQLTLPLMELILAANSQSSPVASRLLCAMFEVGQATERIRAAAAVIHLGFCDPVHTPKAVKILLQPLVALTGQPGLCSNTEGEIQEELQNKTTCTSIILTCVTQLHQITLLPDHFLPCKPLLIVSSVVSLLHMSIGGAVASSTCGEVNRCIIGNGKIQKSALEALAAVCVCSGASDKVHEVFTILLMFLNHPDSDPTVLHKCYQAVLKWTKVCTNQSWMSDELRQDLLRVVQKRICDQRWETRDSTVEFLGQQSALTASQSLLLEECSTLPLLMEALQDQESYVRASAVSALAQVLHRGWKQGATVSAQQTDIVAKLQTILCEDTEGFSRRAVVQFFISWYSCSSFSLLMSSIPSILSRGSSDLDWEVKVHTLELAKLLMDSSLIDHTQPSHPYAINPQPTSNCSLEDSLSHLVEQGVITALLSGLFDCDRPVGLKACLLLMNLQETLKNTECKVKCSLLSWGWGQEIRSLIGNSVGTEGSVNVQEVLHCLHLEKRLDILSRSSDHVQNSPLSLLQDILTAQDVHSHSEDQEVIVDCY